MTDHNMIDLHCHILPGLDDGARDLDDSLAMARQAERDGIVAVCATPHIRHDHNVRIEEIAPRVRSLQAHLDAEGIGVRILPGGELAQTQADGLSDQELHAVALGGNEGARDGAGGDGEDRGWILLEPAPGPLDDDLHELAGRLAQRGLKTIIAHPERHAGADFSERLRRLAGDGCLIQWTAEFIAEAEPGGFVIELAREGLVDLLSSDAHSSHAGRPVALAAGFAHLAEVCSAEQIAWSAEVAPQAIVRGDPVTPRP
ncbi:MAG: tyrosine-protein phosphatase [Solirubrobacteraceae bacterium]